MVLVARLKVKQHTPAIELQLKPRQHYSENREKQMSLSNEELAALWESATELRKSLDAAEYKHIVLGLVFLKYISDSFEARRAELEILFADSKSDSYKSDLKRRTAALDERDRYKEVNVFWVPKEARWEEIISNATNTKIADIIDEALLQVQLANPKLESILERKYRDAKLTPIQLGAVVALVGKMNFGEGRAASADTLGQVYEYFLGKFAAAEGKLGGQFYTTPSIVRTLVEVLQPLKGRVYDPCCGSGGMFVQSTRFVEARGGALGSIAIYGQESNATTRRLAAMNLAIRGIEFDLGNTHMDTWEKDLHEDKRFEYILMNPPFGSKVAYPKSKLLGDVRWKKYGIPREKPANFAWMSHALHHLTPKGRAGIVMGRSSVSSNQDTDGQIRTAFLDDDVVECIIDMPGQLFFNVQIPCTLWFFNKDKSQWKNRRENQVLFIDARKLGYPISRNQIAFSDEDIKKIVDTFDAWTNGEYKDIDWFCKSVDREVIREKGDTLAPGRYIGTEIEDIEDGTFEERMQTLTLKLSEQMQGSHVLDEAIRIQLKEIGYEV
jgi:type I restriction enzyme M protein